MMGKAVCVAWDLAVGGCGVAGWDQAEAWDLSFKQAARAP
jgi:hypothetical protein